jgi:hypothetical protein
LPVADADSSAHEFASQGGTKPELLKIGAISSAGGLELCYGGCMFHSLKNGNRFEEKDYYCAGYKMYFEHMLTRMHNDVSRLERDTRAKRSMPAKKSTRSALSDKS